MPLPKAIAILVLMSSLPLGYAQAPNPLAQFNASIRGLTQRVSPAIVEITVTGYGAPDEYNNPDDGQRTFHEKAASCQVHCLVVSALHQTADQREAR